MTPIPSPSIESTNSPASDAAFWRRHHRQNAFAWGILVVALAFMIGTSFAVHPDEIDSGAVWLSPTCPSKRFFGVECPTCGMTRGFSSLSHGLWRRAMEYNRGSPLFYALAWVGVVWGTINAARSLREARRIGRRRMNP